MSWNKKKRNTQSMAQTLVCGKEKQLQQPSSPSCNGACLLLDARSTMRSSRDSSSNCDRVQLSISIVQIDRKLKWSHRHIRVYTRRTYVLWLGIILFALLTAYLEIKSFNTSIVFIFKLDCDSRKRKTAVPIHSPQR